MSDIIGSEQGSYAMAKPGGDITAIELNQEVNLFGSSLTNLTGTTMETFPPVKDATEPKVAQQEKQEEEEEGSWWGNLIGGALATAAIAGLAVLTVATCGVGLAAVALAGAAVGTGVVTAGVAYTDAKSGHARTGTQFAKELAGGAMIGATSAAAIYGMWTVLPATSQAAGIQASMWMGTTSSFTVSTVPTLATYGGYGVMAVNGAFALNEINTIGTGQNVMADYVFDGDVQAYETAQMVSGMALMGYAEVGMRNAALGTNGGKNSNNASNSTTTGGESEQNNNSTNEPSGGSGSSSGKSSSGGNQGIKMEPETPQKHSLSNVEARKWYLEQEKKIPDMIDKNSSLEEQAKQAFNLRNKFRTEARELMADRTTAEQLYRADPNRTWEQIVQRQKDKGLVGDDVYREIIESSQRSRKSVNKSLGLE